MLNIRNSEEIFQQDNRPSETPAALLSEMPGVHSSTAAGAGHADTIPQPAAGRGNLQGVPELESAEAAVSGMESGLDTSSGSLANQAEESVQVLSLEPLSFGEQLRNLRAEAGMTVADVAQKVRSSRDFIFNLESGDFQKLRQHDHYCKSFIERICLVYQADPDELLEKFDQESRAAGRFTHLPETAQASGVPGGYVFAEEDLNEDKAVNPALHLPAILISILIGLLVVLLISAWIMQKVRERKNIQIMQKIEEELPHLITVKKRPLEVLPIPNN